MKSLLPISFLLFVSVLHAQERPDDIVGKWLKIPKEDMIIQVFRAGREYRGKVDWIKAPDPKRPVGFVIIDGLSYDAASSRWKKGRIRTADSNKSYSAVAEIKPDGTLEVTGFAGLKLFSRSRSFKRVE